MNGSCVDIVVDSSWQGATPVLLKSRNSVFNDTGTGIVCCLGCMSSNCQSMVGGVAGAELSKQLFRYQSIVQKCPFKLERAKQGKNGHPQGRSCCLFIAHHKDNWVKDAVPAAGATSLAETLGRSPAIVASSPAAMRRSSQDKTALLNSIYHLISFGLGVVSEFVL